MFGVDFPLAVREFYNPFSVSSTHALDGTVCKHALLSSIDVQILDGLVWEYDFFSSIYIVLFDLVTRKINKERHWSEESFGKASVGRDHGGKGPRIHGLALT